ncbi:MAG: ribosomal-processing cysteine protease Prp [Clostridia bacterium]|nr:ribosomal-processing cysteine protease Prp [Clostridia bacterium]
MTKVRFELKDGELAFSAKGHAEGPAERRGVSGRDIICAAASILCYTLAQTVGFMDSDGQTEEKPLLSLSPGDCEIRIRPKPEFFAEAVHAFLVIENGFALLSKNFKDKVTLSQLLT